MALHLVCDRCGDQGDLWLQPFRYARNASGAGHVAQCLRKARNQLGKTICLGPGRLAVLRFGLLTYNHGLKEPVLTEKTVVRLENLDELSKEFRPYKQLVERLNRTYKFHTRSRTGFQKLDRCNELNHIVRRLLQLPQATCRIETSAIFR